MCVWVKALRVISFSEAASCMFTSQKTFWSKILFSLEWNKSILMQQAHFAIHYFCFKTIKCPLNKKAVPCIDFSRRRDSTLTLCSAYALYSHQPFKQSCPCWGSVEERGFNRACTHQVWNNSLIACIIEKSGSAYCEDGKILTNHLSDDVCSH